MIDKSKPAHSIALVSAYLESINTEHYINYSHGAYDIVTANGKKIKIFCRNAKGNTVRVPQNYSPEDDVFHLLVSPTSNNKLGFVCHIADKHDVERSIVRFKTPGIPSRLSFGLFRPIVGLKKYLLSWQN